MINQPTSRKEMWRRRGPGSISFAALRLYLSVALGGAVGLVITVLRDDLLPAQYNRDADRIYQIASGQVPDFSDRSYTPVGVAYRTLGLGESPDAAAIVGYLLACAVIIVALYRSGRRSADWFVSIYIFAAFVLSGVYLGQYSKDVFVLLVILLVLLLGKSIWWELVSLAAMLLYAYFFRDYWYIVAAVFVVYRVIVFVQTRVRYLLLGGSVAAVAIGATFHVLRGVDPNHYRTAVQDNLDANTLIFPLEFAAQPWGGMVDVFLNYWLIYAPVLLPVTAGLVYIIVFIGYTYVKALYLGYFRSARRWPSRRSTDGVIVRRSIALLLALSVVQALFEPDIGSALRHFVPLMPLAIAAMQAMKSGTPRDSEAVAWNWTGASRRPKSRSDRESFGQGAEHQRDTATGAP